MNKALSVTSMSGTRLNLSVQGIRDYFASDVERMAFVTMSRATAGPILVHATVAELDALYAEVMQSEVPEHHPVVLGRLQ